MWRAMIAAVLLAGCGTIGKVGDRLGLGDDDDGPPPPDATLSAILAAQPRACPNGRTLEGANREAFGPQHGVTGTDIALTPLASDPTRAVRMRRLEIEPGGVIAWHAHDQVQGMAIVLAGEMTEVRNSCMDTMLYRSGDVANEDAQTAHGWRNDGDVTAVVLTAHVVPRAN